MNVDTEGRFPPKRGGDVGRRIGEGKKKESDEERTKTFCL
jgi:hypothetical protein